MYNFLSKNARGGVMGAGDGVRDDGGEIWSAVSDEGEGVKEER